jgi:hypothetical protein
MAGKPGGMAHIVEQLVQQALLGGGLPGEGVDGLTLGYADEEQAR